jgi:hypothetical protein
MPTAEIASDMVDQARSAITGLLDQLRTGAVLDRYDAGSLQLDLAELTRHLDDISDPVGALHHHERSA